MCSKSKSEELSPTEETLALSKIQVKFLEKLKVIPDGNEKKFGIFPAFSDLSQKVLAECSDRGFADELICRSNAHEELLDLCVEAEKFIRNAVDTIQGQFNEGKRRNRFDIEKRLRKAIKKNGRSVSP